MHETIPTIENSLQKSMVILDEVGRELGFDDRKRSYHVTRSILHAIRDHLTVEEATDFAAELPLVLKGVYYDSWNPNQKPLKNRNKADFVGFVSKTLGDNPALPIEKTCRLTFTVLRRHISEGEAADVLHCLPRSVREIFSEGAGEMK